ncbi:MAG: metallopeptidase family protein [Longimicrobiales bacterium]|nr:metallopeptidase family protein [Longimicrobiales bacterium]
MDLKTFTVVAEAAFEAVPEAYREGIDGLVIERRAEPHPSLPGIYTLGLCDTESYHSDYVSAETTRSRVILYWGSFRALARRDPDFDWEAEIHETVQHEIKHHLEWLAGEDSLGGVDYAMDEAFKRGEGLDFDPWFYQHGEPMGRGVYVVEDMVFLEQDWSGADFEAAEDVAVRWAGAEYRLPRPEALGDVHFVLLYGIQDPPPWFELVLLRRRSWWEDARRLFSTSRPRVLHSEAEVRRGASPPPATAPGS